MKLKRMSIWFRQFPGLMLVVLQTAFGIVGCNANQPESPVEEIIVVCKTHFDIGFTQQISDLIPYFRTTMIDEALAIMEDSEALPDDQQFVWTAPAWVMNKVLEDWEGQTPERRRKLEKAFRSGRFVSHALPFTSHSDLMSPEEFARGVQYASLVAQKYGLPLPCDAKVTDVPSHTTAMVTGLAQSGVKFIHIGCNWPSHPVDYPGMFWWEGPDGSRILTIYSSIYGTSTGLWSWYLGGNRGEDHPGLVGTNLLPPENWPHKVWLAIMVTLDNTGPPDAEALRPLFEEVAEKMPGVKVRMGRMQDFAEAIIASGAELPVVKKEAPDTWIHGVMSDPRGVKTYRNLQPLTSVAEILNTQMQVWSLPVEDATEKLWNANEQMMLYAEHTWGLGEVVRVYGEEFFEQPEGRYKALEDSWEDKSNYVRTADSIIRHSVENDLAVLAKRTGMEGKRMVVYNPLPWKRSGIIEVPGSHGRKFLAEDIPASGYRTFALNNPGFTEREQRSSGSIENEYYEITFDTEEGIISSIIEKRTGKNWVSTSADNGFGQYMNERFTYEQSVDFTSRYQNNRYLDSLGNQRLHPGIAKPGMVSESIVPYRAVSPVNATLTITSDDFFQHAVLSFQEDKIRHLPAAELHVHLASGTPYVDLECVILDKRKDNWPEADWFCMPFNIEEPTFRIGRALGTINPATDLLKGSNRHLFSVGSGVTITGADGAGVALCPLDHPLISIDQPGIWKFSYDFVPEEPVIYLNLYNNMWNTNFRYWYEGSWSSRVRLWTFDHSSNGVESFQTSSLEARVPLLAAVAESPGGDMPVELQGIVCSRKGVVITAYDNGMYDPEGRLIRVWEQAGRSGHITISIPREMNVTVAQPVNLRGELAGEVLPVHNGQLTFNLGKYAPASFILK
jgi:alpha-mannosidase